MRRRSLLLTAPALLSTFLGGCLVGPDYRRPATDTPAAFTEPSPWKIAAPRDHLPKGEWWQVYRDPTLDRLQAEAAGASPTLQAAVARVDQARALARFSRADLLPDVAANPSATRGRTPPNDRTGAPAVTGNAFSLPVDLAYELDLWGRVRRASQSAVALAEASEADRQNISLGVQAEVARTYFALRALNLEKDLVTRTLTSRRDALQIVTRRLDLGAGGELDVQLATTELAAAEGDLLALEQERTALRHALAVLCGQLPETFVLEEDATTPAPVPVIPLALPSELLERRPDVATAERTLAAASAEIGVAQAAFFPSVTLVGSAGYQSTTLETLTRWDQRAWAFGPGLSLPLFTGGRNTANLRRAQAVHAEALANYRQSVLNAFRDVEVSLSDLRLLAERSLVLDRAVASSRRAAEIVTARYQSGQIGYLDVTDAERIALLNQRLAAQLRGQHLIASVALVRALGGGW